MLRSRSHPRVEGVGELFAQTYQHDFSLHGCWRWLSFRIGIVKPVPPPSISRWSIRQCSLKAIAILSIFDPSQYRISAAYHLDQEMQQFAPKMQSCGKTLIHRRTLSRRRLFAAMASTFSSDVMVLANMRRVRVNKPCSKAVTQIDDEAAKRLRLVALLNYIRHSRAQVKFGVAVWGHTLNLGLKKTSSRCGC